jgi:sugar phosphate permease
MLAVAVAAQTGASFIHQGLPALGPLLQAEWALTRAEFGVVASALNIGVLLTSAAAGQLVDRVGERPVLAVGPLGVAACTLLCTLSPSPLVLTLSLVAAGGFLATCAPSGGKAILLWFPTRLRGLAMGLRQTSIPLAGVAAAVGLPLVAAAVGWRGALAVSAAIAAMGGLLIWLLYRDPPSPASVATAGRTGFSAIPALLRDRSLVATIALGPALVAAQWTVVAYMGLYLYERFGWSVVAAATYLAVAQLGGVLGRLAWGFASDHVWSGRRKPALAFIPPAGALALVGLALLPPGASTGLVAALALALGLTAIGWNGLFLTFLAEQAGPGRAGTAIGLGVSAVFLGAVVSPPLFGWIVDRTGSYQLAWLLVAGVLVAALALFPLMRDVTPEA